MSDLDEELAEIRERKRAEIRERAQGTNQSSSYPDTPVTIESESHFEELLEQYAIVLVDFYADWCGPCQMLAPTLDSLDADLPVTIAKVDTDAHPGLAQRHGVRGLPTLILFQEGEPVEQLVGMQGEARLRQVIERNQPATDH